ncbi:hypothetical protein [Psychrosphaera algicola]|uniref:Uncharacterized protein n=3 Tax=Psychrosphaera TaxID=907197 RepID=A0ABT5FEA9_9GAMM|nr:hypothetical protein [Psychrosphaera sp. G1-22]MDC2889292.1 hypothetical protein [Psychrosphaera sp. G1-22]
MRNNILRNDNDEGTELSNKTYLFKNSINQMLDLISNLEAGQTKMPNDIELTKLLSISRTTVRTCVEELIKTGVIKRDGFNKIVLRPPTKEDYYEIDEQNSTKEVQIEKYFLNLINTSQLLP